MSQYFKTKYPGVRYRKHPTRKHGVNRDQYFLIRYQKDGIRKEEGLGWASQGWTADRANSELAQLKNAARIGAGPQRLHEAREEEVVRRKKEIESKERQRISSTSFTQFFNMFYFPHATSYKKEHTCKSEERLHRLWLEPVIGELPFGNILPAHLDIIKRNMSEGKRQDTCPLKSKPRPLAPKTICDALALVRQVWNHACREGFANGSWPGIHVKKPVVQNERLRYLSHEEVKMLLEKLKKTSPQLHDIANLSVQTGLRAKEIFSLRWEHIFFDKNMLLAVDTKNTETRPVYLTSTAKEILKKRFPKEQTKQKGLVFLNKKGNQYNQVPCTFGRMVERLKLNEGFEDKRYEATFHTLRHTHASWMVEENISLYVIKVLLGHKSIKTTERYAHVGENMQRQAIRDLSDSLDRKNHQEEK